jgi:competence protein ComEA
MKKSTILFTLIALSFSFGLALATPVDINHADAKTIAKALSGVGEAKAAAIVAYRKAHGPFRTAQDLTHVKGIGPATVQHNLVDIQLGKKASKH